MYAKFEQLLVSHNIKAAQVAKKTRIPASTFSDWKKNKSSPKKEKLSLIANYFRVPPNYFDDNPALECPECGTPYHMPGELENYHDLQHAKWKEAVAKFGFCWPTLAAENAKTIARNVLEKGGLSLSLDERVELNTEIFKAFFSRSLAGNDFSLDHPTFEQYIAMLLNEKQFKGKIDEETYQTMIRLYGTIPGIIEGETYYRIPGKVKKVTPLSKEVTYEDTKKLIARNGKSFTTDQKMELIKLLSEIK